MKILSVNTGSSSLKFQLYEMPEEKVLISGVFERIGIGESFYTIKINGEKIKKEVELKDHKVAFEYLVKELLERKSELTNSLLLNDERFENEPTIVEDNDSYANYADLIEEKEPSLTDNYIKLVDNVNDTISIDKALDENENKKNGSKKFVTTDFISPVFGRRKAEFDYPKVPNFKEMMMKKEKTNEYDLEATLNLEPLAEQMKKDDAFLSALKEFRKNLE